MHTQFSRKPIATALLLASLGTCALPVSAASLQEDVSVSPGRPISAADEAVISSAAVKVLRHIAGARGH